MSQLPHSRRPLDIRAREKTGSLQAPLTTHQKRDLRVPGSSWLLLNLDTGIFGLGSPTVQGDCQPREGLLGLRTQKRKGLPENKATAGLGPCSGTARCDQRFLPLCEKNETALGGPHPGCWALAMAGSLLFHAVGPCSGRLALVLLGTSSNGHPDQRSR